MAKYCGKCGSKLDEDTGLCPKCETAILKDQTKTKAKKETQKQKKINKKEFKRALKNKKKIDKKEKKKAKRAAMTTGQKVRRFFLKMFAILLSVVVVATAITTALSYFNIVEVPVISETVDRAVLYTSRREAAKEIEQAFAAKDIKAISHIIYPEYYIEYDAMQEFGMAPEEPVSNYENSMLNTIFSRTTISLTKIEEESISYRIKAPNMTGVFDNISDFKTTDELRQNVINFANNAELTDFKVSVPYTQMSSGIQIDYQTEEFINAITGGFLSEYQKLLNQMLSDLDFEV